MKAHRIHQKGVFSTSDEALPTLQSPGDVALVVRGVARALLMRCPCGCGDTLVINLDPRAGRAWHFYKRGSALTLFPSYWRDSHCQSHFILWNNRVYWCDWSSNESLWEDPSEIEDRVLAALPDHFIAYEELAEQLEEIPWDVLRACRSLERKKLAVANPDLKRPEFRSAIGTEPTELVGSEG